MRTNPWLRAALPFICASALAIVSHDAIRAQGGSTEHALYVSALDRDGNPVDGLGPDAFVVREGNVRREVLRVSPADDPIDLTVMIDNSQAAREAVSFYRTALPPFLDALTPEHRVALIGLADRPTILVPSTTDTERLTERARAMFPTPQSGMTLLDAMTEVADGIRKREPARAAFAAILTDGPEFTNRYSKDVVSRLVDARIAVHLVTIGRFDLDAEHAERERVFFIDQAPRATGGSHRSMVSPHGLDNQLQQLARELTSQYKVVYARPDSLIPPETVTVTSARDGLVVRGTPERARKGA